MKNKYLYCGFKVLFPLWVKAVGEQKGFFICREDLVDNEVLECTTCTNVVQRSCDEKQEPETLWKLLRRSFYHHMAGIHIEILPWELSVLYSTSEVTFGWVWVGRKNCKVTAVGSNVEEQYRLWRQAVCLFYTSTYHSPRKKSLNRRKCYSLEMKRLMHFPFQVGWHRGLVDCLLWGTRLWDVGADKKPILWMAEKHKEIKSENST